MKNSDKEKNTVVPLLRFPEFRGTEGWEEMKLGDVTYNVSRKNKDGIKLPIYSINNKEGFLPQSDQFEGMDSNERGYDITLYKIIEKNTFAYNPARIDVGSLGYSGDLNNIIISSLYVCFKTNELADDTFLLHFLKTNYFNQAVKNATEGGIRSYLFYENFSTIKFYLPPSVKEQQKIADCLTSIDALITAQSEKIAALKAHKKGLMQQLFPAEGETVPALRFEEWRDTEGWEEKTLGDITYKVSKKNKEGIKFPIYSINNKEGFLPQSDQFEGMDSNERGYDITLYKIIERNTFAYNPARIDVGSLGYSGDLHNVIISSLYVCFKTKEDVDDSFLLHFLKTNYFNQAVRKGVEGGIRNYLFYENFSIIKFYLPKDKAEQQKIADCLSSLDDLIKAESDKVEGLKAHKKGLMQQLFPKTKEES